MIPSLMLLTVIVLCAITILFLLDFILFLGFLKLVIFFSFEPIGCAAAPFNILFFFFILLLVSEQFIHYFFTGAPFPSRYSFPLTLYLHALFVGGSNSSVNFTGRDMI